MSWSFITTSDPAIGISLSSVSFSVSRSFSIRNPGNRRQCLRHIMSCCARVTSESLAVTTPNCVIQWASELSGFRFGGGIPTIAVLYCILYLNYCLNSTIQWRRRRWKRHETILHTNNNIKLAKLALDNFVIKSSDLLLSWDTEAVDFHAASTASIASASISQFTY